jgi:hypothetical protein
MKPSRLPMLRGFRSHRAAVPPRLRSVQLPGLPVGTDHLDLFRLNPRVEENDSGT